MTPGPAATESPAADEQADPAPGRPQDRVADPVRVLVPRLGIDAALDPLELGAAQELVPPEYGRAGWYADGPEPGEFGRAVIAGHVDSKTGPDVFAALHRARTGDRIEIELADGDEVEFRVSELDVFPRSDFPTARVYGGPKETSEIRLITCTGEYDRARGGYQDNVVVFGTLVG